MKLSEIWSQILWVIVVGFVIAVLAGWFAGAYGPSDVLQFCKQLVTAIYDVIKTPLFYSIFFLLISFFLGFLFGRETSMWKAKDIVLFYKRCRTRIYVFFETLPSHFTRRLFIFIPLIVFTILIVMYLSDEEKLGVALLKFKQLEGPNEKEDVVFPHYLEVALIETLDSLRLRNEVRVTNDSVGAHIQSYGTITKERVQSEIIVNTTVIYPFKGIQLEPHEWKMEFPLSTVHLDSTDCKKRIGKEVVDSVLLDVVLFILAAEKFARRDMMAASRLSQGLGRKPANMRAYIGDRWYSYDQVREQSGLQVLQIVQKKSANILFFPGNYQEFRKKVEDAYNEAIKLDTAHAEVYRSKRDSVLLELDNRYKERIGPK
jgi:hypothetical protein